VTDAEVAVENALGELAVEFHVSALLVHPR
jgi:hypothetical protein